VGGGLVEPDDLLAEGVLEVNMFERTQSLIVEVNWMINELTEVDGECQTVRIELDDSVSDVQNFIAHNH
jgi:hypothetical protein